MRRKFTHLDALNEAAEACSEGEVGLDFACQQLDEVEVLEMSVVLGILKAAFAGSEPDEHGSV